MKKYIIFIMLTIMSAFRMSADLISADINDLILEPGSLVPTWDMTNIDNYGVNETAGCLEILGDTNSEIAFTYTSDVPVALITKHDAEALGYNTNPYIYVYLDDNTQREYSIDMAHVNANYNPKKWLPSGTHKIRLGKSSSYVTPIIKLNLMPLKELTDGMYGEYNDTAVTWENDANNPWILYENELFPIDATSYERSTLKGTFTVDKYARVYFSVYNLNGWQGHSKIKVYIDGEQVCYIFNQSDNKERYCGYAVAPGTHTIIIEEYNDLDLNKEYYHRSIFKNLNIESTYTDIYLSTPGTLGAEILKYHNTLDDVRNLTITGELSDEDWSNLKLCTNLHMLDIRNVPNTTMPESQFSGKPIYWIGLPESLQSIPKEAFYNGYLTRIEIPASVKTIGGSAFYKADLMKSVSFANDSKLQNINSSAFRGCIFESFEMPSSVTYVGQYAFSENSSLKNLKVSPLLTSIPDYFANQCSNLQEIIIPDGVTSIGSKAYYYCKNVAKELQLPSSIVSIADDAFQNANIVGGLVLPEGITSLGNTYNEYIFAYNENMNYVSLPSSMKSMGNYLFYDTGIKSIDAAMPSPISYGTAFNGLTLSNITVQVPDFAEIAYKLDSNWKQFGKITGSKELATRELWNMYQEVDLGDKFRLYGAPTLNMQHGGGLKVSGETPQNFKDFNFFAGRYSGTYNNNYYEGKEPGSYVSDCTVSSVSGEMNLKYYLTANKWYFFSLPADVKMEDIRHSEGGEWVIRYYDGARRASENTNSGNWTNVPANGVLTRGTGYIAQTSTAGYLVMPVAKEEHPEVLLQPEFGVEMPENACETAANAGWSYIGNPYPCYFDINDIDLDAPITIFDGSTYKALSLTDDNYALRPMEGFFVQKPATQASLTLLRSGRQINSTIKAKKVRLQAKSLDRDFIELAISTLPEEKEDETRLVVSPTASLNYDSSVDAAKFLSIVPTVAQIYTLDSDGIMMAIKERPYGNGEVPLGVYTPEKGMVYFISTGRLDRQAWIYDSLTGIETELSEEVPYSFISDRSGNDDTRFTLRFAPAASGVSENGIDGETLRVAGMEGYMTLCGAEGMEVIVSGVDGSILYSGKPESRSLEIRCDAGVHLVKVGGRSFKVIVK